jgi:F-type H+-transporting ATPase subunit gamma
MLQQFIDGKLDAVQLCFTRFVNTMKQEPQIVPLLPLTSAGLQSDDKGEKAGYAWDYIYEPDAPGVIEELLKRYIEALVFQGVAENMASEQAARMVAMKAATDNAGNLIGELKLIYNKTRQAAITKELSEIVGGAAAV